MLYGWQMLLIIASIVTIYMLIILGIFFIICFIVKTIYIKIRKRKDAKKILQRK